MAAEKSPFVAEENFTEYIDVLKSLKLSDKELVKLRDEAVLSLQYTRLWFSHSLIQWNDLYAIILNELKEDINNTSPFYSPILRLVKTEEQLLLANAELNKNLVLNFKNCLLRADEIFMMKQRKIAVPVFGKPKTDAQKDAFKLVIQEKLSQIKEELDDLSSAELAAKKYSLKTTFGSEDGNTENDVIIDQLWADYIDEGKSIEDDDFVEGKEQDYDSESQA